jgi:membrane AbrB-like protein
MRLGLPAAFAWAVLLAVLVAVSKGFSLAGLPSAVLFAGLVVGIGYAVFGRTPLELPHGAAHGGQAVIGVTAGLYLRSSTLHAVASHWAPVIFATVSTLVISVVCGLLLSRLSRIDQATSSFGMIAGGAAGIVAISHELGADERLVAVLQYLRVLLIVALAPVVAGAIFGLGGHQLHPAAASHSSALWGLGFVAVCSLVGIELGRRVRLPAGALLGPLFVAGAVSLAAPSWTAPVPSFVQSFAFAVIGLQVGLRFTPDSLRQARSVLPLAFLMLMLMIGLCALLGVVLASLARVSELDGYLATTPGGLAAVLAMAVGNNTNATFIISVQLLRTLLMLIAAPWLAMWIARGRTVTP